MFHDPLRFIPLFSAALVGAYLCAVFVALLDRRRKKKAGASVGPSTRLFRGAFGMWIPVCFCVGPGLYWSAMVGGVFGALICAIYLVYKYAACAPKNKKA